MKHPYIEKLKYQALLDRIAELEKLNELALSYSFIEDLDEVNPELYYLAYAVFEITSEFLKEQEDQS